VKYSAKDHAFVYGVIAQALIRQGGEAKSVLEESIKVYGAQRGSRMGQTADAFGDQRTMQTYLLYGEWVSAAGEMIVDVTEETPCAVWHVHKCPWNEAWTELGMLDVGKYYCKHVDRELVHGYNPDLELGVGETQTNGDSYCYFKWTGAEITPANELENAKISEKVGTVRLRNWAYHMAHIYKTMGEVIQKRLGCAARSAVFFEADERLLSRYGQHLVDLMHAGLIVDFWVTPSLKPVELLPVLFQD
jgi:hypothetical protein